jgi:Alginate lyase
VIVARGVRSCKPRFISRRHYHDVPELMTNAPHAITRRSLLRLLVAAALAIPVRARVGRAATRSPATFVLDGAALQQLHADLLAGDRLLASALRVLMDDAAEALTQAPLTVTSKAQLPPSGDRRDYLSQAPYFWPNRDSVDGLPYVRRDGQVNPSAASIPDAEALDRLESRAGILALAYFYTSDARYSAGAAMLLRTWFVDPATAMNPNLTYAQLIPGVAEARPSGIIEGHVLCRIPDWCALLAESPDWTADDMRALRGWFGQYADWLERSASGRAAARLKNNQGSWYFAQLAVVHQFGGDPARARRAVHAGQKLLRAQVYARGMQPLELARTRPLAYSTFNLRGQFTLAAAGQALGESSWCQADLRRALNYVLTQALKRSDQARDDLRARDLAELALQASARYALTSARRAVRCG